LKRLLQALGLGLVLVLATAVGRTLSLSSRQVAVVAVARFELDESQAAQRLAGAIRLRTVSAPELREAQAFADFRAYLADSWPLVNEKLGREEVGESLLFTWPGSDLAAAPVVLMAHQDVVPIEPGTEAKWTQPPWEGRIVDGFVWGRGAMDDKGSLCATLEAVQSLLAEGFVPRRTVYLAMGHDEEVKGSGASALVDLLASRGVKPAWVLDEASAITDGVVKGLKSKAALISVAEKGVLTLELKVEGPAGHSAMPPAQTNAGILAAAIVRLEANPFPASFEGPVGDFFDTLAPQMPFGPRMALSNRWLFGPLLKRQLLAAPATSASLRTTTAVTMLSSGVKENVLPNSAWAAVNFRIRAGESRASVAARVREVIDDARVTVTAREATLTSEPSPVSPVDAEGYRLIERTIRGVFPDTVVAPNASNGASDSRFFTRITPQVYRFVPMVLTPEDLPRVHGTDERISVSGYAEMVRFYRQLLKDDGAR
jgi:carboxypeptidase PM20D1